MALPEPFTHNITVYVGSTFDSSLYLYTVAAGLDPEDEGNWVAEDFGGATARMEVRKKKTSEDVILTLTTEATTDNPYLRLGESQGQVHIVIPYAHTASLDRSLKTGVYDIEILYSTGIKLRRIEGEVEFNLDVTQDEVVA